MNIKQEPGKKPARCFLKGCTVTKSTFFTLFRYGEAPQFSIPPELMQHFRSYDRNVDGNIDPYEFLALAQDMNLTSPIPLMTNGVCFILLYFVFNL